MMNSVSLHRSLTQEKWNGFYGSEYAEEIILISSWFLLVLVSFLVFTLKSLYVTFFKIEK